MPQVLTTVPHAENVGSFDKISYRMIPNVNFYVRPILQLFVLVCVQSINHSTKKHYKNGCVCNFTCEVMS